MSNESILSELTTTEGARHARCSCGGEADSAQPDGRVLPFFLKRPDRETDEFFCGCRGWD